MHETLERLDLALEGAELGVWDWDPRNNTVHFDRRWCEMLGLDIARTPMRFETWESLVHPDDLETCMSAVRAHLEGHTPRYEALHRVRHADGTWRFILARGRVSARDAEGRPIRVTGTHTDLTGTPLGVRTLEDERAHAAEIVGQSPYAVALLDPSLRYLGASARWREEFELGDAPLEGMQLTPRSATAGPDWPGIAKRALEGEVQLRGDEEPITGPDGAPRWIRWHVRPWLHDGAVSGVMLSLDDITAAVQARHLREAELEGRLSDLSEFAGDLAQELKTPLQVISMAADALEKSIRHGDHDPGKLLQGTRALTEMTRRASAVARALRALSERGRPGPDERVSMTTLFSNAAALTTARFLHGGVTLTMQNEARSSPVGRPADLMRMLMDLLDHAHDSARRAPSPADRWVRLEARDTDGHVVLRCTDGGPPDPPDAKPTGDPASAPGLRVLRIARILAERSHGTLHMVTDAPHRTFEVRLPTAT